VAVGASMKGWRLFPLIFLMPPQEQTLRQLATPLFS
jgi:hypothetical protein